MGPAGGRASPCRRGARSGFTSRVARLKSSSSSTFAFGSGGERIQVLLGVERCHAPGAAARHRLPVDVILDVAGGEHALYAGCGGEALAPAAGDDIAVFHFELTGEELGVRRVPDGDEESLGGDVLDLAGLELAYAHAGDSGRVAQHVVHHGV